MVTLVNRAKVSTSTTGTGTITLGAAVDGYQTFAGAGATDGQTVRYVIEDGANWEIGAGTYTASGTTLSRTVVESSNADAAINLSGTAVVFISAAASDIVQPNDNVSVLTNDAGYTTNTGTVTSVAASAGTGISVSGSPITTSGTLTITNTAPHIATNLGYTTAATTGTVTSSTGTNATLPAATTTLAGLLTGADKTKLDGIAAGAQVNVPTNLGYTTASATGTVTSSTGTNATLPAATTTLAGLMTGADKTKLNGIATGATANAGTVTSVAASAGAGISVTGSPITTNGTLTITNTAPDRTVVLTQGANVSITGTYPNFTIASSDTNTTYTAGGGLVLTGTQFSIATTVVTSTYTGDVNITGELIVDSYNETFVSVSGTAPTINCEAGNVFALTTSGNTTFTFANPPATGTAYGFTLKVTAGGTHTLTWPASVDWSGGAAPDAPASGETDVFVFFTHNGGTIWYGFQAGDALA